VWYPSAVHIHSNWSYDAHWPLEKIRSFFIRRHFKIVLMSEHDRTFNSDSWRKYQEACRRTSTSSLLLVPGIEYSDPTNTVHILVWGDLPFLGINQAPLDVLKRVHSMGGVSVIAHPAHRNAQSLIPPECYRFLDGMEIWNRKADGVAPSKTAVLLQKKFGLIPFYGLDFHQINQFFPISQQIFVTGQMHEKNVISALKNQQCYPKIMGLTKSSSMQIGNSVILLYLETLRRILRFIIKGRKFN